MNKGLIIINGYFCNDAVKNQINCLSEEFGKVDFKIDVLKSNMVLAYIQNQDIVTSIIDYKFIIFLDKDYILASMLEKKGYKVFNSSEAIRLCDDKMLTYSALVCNKIELPLTIPAPLQYVPSMDENFLNIVESKIPYPIIVKKVYGSMGKGVFMVKNHNELLTKYNELKSVPHIYQQKVGKEGEDIRVIVIGDKIVASMKRYNNNDFRSNIELGGKGEKVILTDRQKEISIGSVKKLGLDYAGVDILSDEKDYICEVNSNAFFKGISEVTGVNVAKNYVDYIIKHIE